MGLDGIMQQVGTSFQYDSVKKSCSRLCQDGILSSHGKGCYSLLNKQAALFLLEHGKVRSHSLVSTLTSVPVDQMERRLDIARAVVEHHRFPRSRDLRLPDDNTENLGGRLS